MPVVTKERKVHLCDQGGKDFVPEVVLMPMTHLELLIHQLPQGAVALLASQWVHVRVLGGPHAKKEGWVAAAALADYSRSHLPFSSGTTGITGRSYGEDVLLWDGQANTLWTPNCQHCGNDPESHRLEETVIADGTAYVSAKGLGARSSEEAINNPRAAGTADDAIRLYGALLAGQARAKQGIGFGQGARIMIGVLHVAESDNVYASHSGKDINPGFKAVAEDLGFIYAPPVSGEVLTRSGGRAHVSLQNPAQFQCAAPRLIQAALKAGEWPYSMTETWFNPKANHAKYADQHFTESCDLCRGTVPLMLCPD
jgi:hypothetical protein